ncbi:MAG: BON domain-containing protein [Neisseria animaloris]|uniref:Hemolysin, putative n=1 Tax=Neisseria animaloris TaxID=326522 RepID=A0A448UCU4_9NEIS|nr:BON domain-containing protein [Neisseria animaloris]MDO5073849.1 BON domain-containing protein [Neisseria animaloris]VEJ21720.1 Hemolysin, putative [Neisseria animaloris]
MNIKQYAKTLIAAGILATTLSGCVGAILGGAAVGGAAAIDRRSAGAQADDNVMEVRIKHTALSYLRQNSKATGFEPKLAVVSYNRHILLLGHVATEGEKAFVEQVARSEQSAQEVYNYINVGTQQRTFGNVTDDTWSTSKVRTTLLGVQGVIPSRVKIVTYDGVTYVMGILSPTEQAAITERVSTTSGVKKVVTLYQNYNN